MNKRAEVEWRNRWATAIHRQRTQVLRMSQSQFARWIGATQSAVGNWEGGKHVPHDLMKVRLMRAAALDPREMFRPLDADPIEFPEDPDDH